MKFIHLTDPHLVAPGEPLHGLDPHANLLVSVAATRARRADAAFCVLTGDLVDNGDPRANRAASQALAALPMPVHVIPGNHDDRVAVREAFAHTRCDEHGFSTLHGTDHQVLLDLHEPRYIAFTSRRATASSCSMATAA